MPSHTDEGMRAAVQVRAADPAARVLVLSQYVVLAYADELLADGRGGVGYLLKDRVSRLDTFLGAIEQVAAGGTSLDPDVVTQLFGRRPAEADPVDRLTPRDALPARPARVATGSTSHGTTRRRCPPPRRPHPARVPQHSPPAAHPTGPPTGGPGYPVRWLVAARTSTGARPVRMSLKASTVAWR